MATWLDSDGLVYLWSKIKALVVANKYVHPTHTSKDSGLYKVTVDTEGHVTAATAVAKSDITALGIPAQDTTYNVATSTASGLMSGADKAKLDGIAENANNYTHPTHDAAASGLYKVTVDTKGHVTGTVAVAKSDITALGIPAKDTTYSVATASSNGLMSKADFSKLAAFGEASTYALKTDITGLYKYKGSVASYDKLPTSGQTTGDVYNVETDGQNYAWTGSAWDSLGGIFTINRITNADIDTICA